MFKIPTFSLTDQNGKTWTEKNMKGAYTVLFAYPKALTPGCTKESCEFRDRYAELKGMGVKVFGISADTPELQKKFEVSERLNFPLLADTEKELLTPLEVWKLKKNYGKEYMGIERSTFLIGPDLEVVQAWRNVKVEGHVEKVTMKLKEVIASTKGG